MSQVIELPWFVSTPLSCSSKSTFESLLKELEEGVFKAHAQTYNPFSIVLSPVLFSETGTEDSQVRKKGVLEAGQNN